MTGLPTWAWFAVGLVMVAWLWETHRWIAAVLVVLVALFYLSRR